MKKVLRYVCLHGVVVYTDDIILKDDKWYVSKSRQCSAATDEAQIEFKEEEEMPPHKLSHLINALLELAGPKN